MYKFFKMTALCAALAAAGAAGAATITLDGTSLSIEDAWKIAAGEADVAIAPEAVKLLEDSHKLVMASASTRTRSSSPPTASSPPKCSKPPARSTTTPCARTPPASVK